MTKKAPGTVPGAFARENPPSRVLYDCVTASLGACGRHLRVAHKRVKGVLEERILYELSYLSIFDSCTSIFEMK